MTQACKNTHIQYIQYLYAQLSNTYLTKLNIGKQCLEAELHLDIARSYLDSLCNYQVFEEEITYAYSFNITRVGEDSVNINITIGTESIIYSGSGTLEEILIYFETQFSNSTDYSFEIYVNEDILYIYSYDNTLTFSTTTTVSSSNSDEATIEETNMQNTYCTILDFQNCLTTEEICTIIQHSQKILKECNCN